MVKSKLQPRGGRGTCFSVGAARGEVVLTCTRPLADFPLLRFSCPGTGLWVAEILRGVFCSETIGKKKKTQLFFKKQSSYFNFVNFIKNLNCGYKPADSKNDVCSKIFMDALSSLLSGAHLNLCI